MTLLEKRGRAHKRCFPMDPLTWPSNSRETSSVRIRDVALRTCQKRWKIRRSCERGSGISMLGAQQDDDDDHETLCINVNLNLNNYAILWCFIDWFYRHVNMSRIILCVKVRESWTLYNYIHSSSCQAGRSPGLNMQHCCSYFINWMQFT